MKFNTLYSITEKVTMDSSKDMVGVITGVRAMGETLHVSYYVEWFNNGALQTAWFEEWRLSKWEE